MRSLCRFASAVLLGFSHAVTAHPARPHVQARAAYPDTPFTISGRDILSASGAKIVYAGANWPGAADTMLPEGLQYSSISNILGSLKSLGMNVIRLTYAIEMIDDIYSNAGDQTLQGTLINALGQTNGTTVLNQILSHNPQFSASTTRLEVFDAIATAAAQQEMWIHLDNHVSKAEWCCSSTDGNAWFGDTYFDVANWQRGLGYMANHVKSWSALASMSLRNELRQPEDSGNSAQPYDWAHWYANMVPAANAIHGNNSLPLIFFSGLNYDTDDSAITNGQDLTPGEYFTPSSFPWANKLVYELHAYANEETSDCPSTEASLEHYGYSAEDVNDSSYPNHAPFVMTEFGFSMVDGSDESEYAQCIKSFLTTDIPGGPGGWMIWVMAGSYYIRTGVQDSDETYGLFNHDFSGWRNQTVIDEYVKPMVAATLG